MTDNRSVAISGLGIELPGLTDVEGFLHLLASSRVTGQAEPEARLGGKGLRYKDRATRLGLSAAKAALEYAGLPSDPKEQLDCDSFGVIVSSNLGNLDTVCRTAEAIRASSVDATSPMDLPNASSNIISASIAIAFKLQGPNMTICNGATSGTEALYIAANAIRARRAERMLVVGVETANDIILRLMNESAQVWAGRTPDLCLGDCAGAVVLEAAHSAAARNAPIHCRLGTYAYASDGDVKRSLHGVSHDDNSVPDLWLMPNCSYSATVNHVENARTLWATAQPHSLDIADALGETYGAAGVLQSVAACLWLAANGGTKAFATTGAAWGDGAATVVIQRGYFS